MKAAGHFFKELSSKEEAGEISIKKQTASIKSGELLICENVKIKSKLVPFAIMVYKLRNFHFVA